MRTAPAFVGANLRVSLLGVGLLLGACAPGDRAHVASIEGCHTETRRVFETAGPKSIGTVVTRQVRVCD
ncbi:hypothetical protein ACIKT0_18555, partial [Hansschlegelia beijingensis]|uniref:hypothetical protein n=1 Tax=Hansschlegelia beijingensis TaxID=1133344 RepID=UPI00387F24C9